MLEMLEVPELGNRLWPLDHQAILRQCREELLHPGYAGYRHGLRNTRARGCDGPMCRKAARDYGREVQRRINAAQGERISAIRKHDEFLEAYIQYAARHHAETGLVPGRRRLKVVRTHRRSHLIPLSVAKMLHKSRARLAS